MANNSAIQSLSGDVQLASADATFIFRPIHYLGSKLRVLAAIENALDCVDPSRGVVCDLFSGSATVSRYLSRHRRVAAVDIQEYARVIAAAVLNGDASSTVESVQTALSNNRRVNTLRRAISPLIELEGKAAQTAMRGDLALLSDLLEMGNLASVQCDQLPVRSPLREAVHASRANIKALGLKGPDTVCVRHFGGQYFSFAQAAELDAIADLARETGSSTLLAAALSTASLLVNSIGKQFAQPIRPKNKAGIPKLHVFKKVIAERQLSARCIFIESLRRYKGLAATRRDHVATRADFRQALATPALMPSVVYADPPYTRDHYSRFYHTLETIAQGDDPSITKSNLDGGRLQSRGGYRAGRHQSPFCIKSEAPAAFSALFAGVAALQIPLVLSYSGYDPSMEARPRVMALDAVVELARHHFENVSVEQLTSLEHMKLNTVALNKASKGTNEVLLLCR